MRFNEVVQRSQQGQSPEQVVSAIRSSRTTYALRGSDFGKLKDAGFDDKVLDYLQQSFMDDVDMLTRYWALGESVGGCTRCVPQQVTIASVDDIRQSPTRTAPSYGGPQGMPDWFVPYSARRKVVSLDLIRQRAQQGASEQELVQLVRDGHLESIIGGQPLGSVRTHFPVALTGSELARLRAEGIPDAVLDEIQNKFLGQFVELQRLRYQSRGKAPSGSFN
jgi:hypothetical protein